jgi:2'-5' RNA ligase
VKGFVPAKGVKRLFIAVDIGDEVRRNLLAEQSILRRDWPAIKWVAVENIHLTLVFLGDVFIEQVPRLVEALDRVAGGTAPFTCGVAGVGTFGSPRAPRVVWAGVTGGRERLAVLQRDVDVAVRALGLRGEERAFTPHLTMARVKWAADAKGLADRLAVAPGKPLGNVAVGAVELIGSELTPKGPVYTVLHTARLKIAIDGYRAQTAV